MRLFGRKCDACKRRRRMLAPVLDVMVCVDCWRAVRAVHQPYNVASAADKACVYNYTGEPWVMTINEALDTARGINAQADNANKARASDTALFGPNPRIEPADFIPIEADSWEGHHMAFKQAARVVA